MLKYLTILVLAFILLSAGSPAGNYSPPAGGVIDSVPNGLPAPYNTQFYRIGSLKADSALIITFRDTTFRPKFPGTTVLWLNTAAHDTSYWGWNGFYWFKVGNAAGGILQFQYGGNPLGTINTLNIDSSLIARISGNTGTVFNKPDTIFTIFPLYGAAFDVIAIYQSGFHQSGFLDSTSYNYFWYKQNAMQWQLNGVPVGMLGGIVHVNFGNGFTETATDSTVNIGISPSGNNNITWVNTLNQVVSGPGVATVYKGDTGILLSLSGDTIKLKVQKDTIYPVNGLQGFSGDSIGLGGHLFENTTVYGDSNYTMTFTSNLSGGGITLSAINTNSGGSFYAQSVSNVAVTGVATNATAGLFTSTSGFGLQASSTSAAAGQFGVDPLSTSTVVEVVAVQRATTGTPANGIGGLLEFDVEDSSLSAKATNQIRSKWTNVNTSAEVSQLEIWGVNTGANAALLALKGSGQLQMFKYGIGTFTGSPTYNVLTDASGNFIEGSVPVGAIASAKNGLTVVGSDTVEWYGNLTRNDTLIGGSFFPVFSSSAANGMKIIDSATSGVGLRVQVTGATSEGISAQGGEFGISAGGTFEGISGGATGAGEGTFGVVGSSVNGIAGYFSAQNVSGTNVIWPVLLFDRQVSGRPLTGYGISLDFALIDSVITYDTAAKINVLWTNSLDSTSAMQLVVLNAGVQTLGQTINGNGQIRLNQYTTSNFLATAGDTTNFKPASFDANGNAFRSPSWYGSGGGGGGDSAIWKNSATYVASETLTMGAFTQTFNGNSSSNLFTVNNTGAGDAIYAQSTHGVSLQGLSTDSIGAVIGVNPPGANTPIEVLLLQRGTSGTASAGIGEYMEFDVQANDGSSRFANEILSSVTNVTPATFTSDLQILGRSSGTILTDMIINGNGSINLPEYGAGTFTGTPTFNLLVTSTGNVIEGVVPVDSATIAGYGITVTRGATYDLVTVDTTKIPVWNDTTGTGTNTLVTTTYFNGHYAGGGLAIGEAIKSATQGSVLFAGSGGKLSQVNAGLFYDSADIRLGVGTASPGQIIHALSSANSASYIESNATSSGNAAAASLLAQADVAGLYFQAFSSGYTTSGLVVAKSVRLVGIGAANLILGTNNTSPVQFEVNGAEVGRFAGTGGDLLLNTTTDNGTLTVAGNIVPEAAGTRHIGSATFPFVDITVKAVINNAAQTTVNGSVSGTAVFSEPEQGTAWKVVVIYLASLNGTASYNFPTAFSNTPVVLSTSGLATTVVGPLSTSAVTVTGGATTGNLFIMGY